MRIKEISDIIFYVGVNDRVTEKFESMWPLPYGVTYNAYLVADEKVALIDTVEICEVEELLKNIRSVKGENAKIDYLIVNHMEPDHSGSIPVLAALYPEMKIVGNKLTVGMVKGYYHIDDDARYIVVGDGDTLPIGQKTLRFITTPMVHWPETMMTYIESDALLFTGDALGTFGALNGAVVDEEMNTEVYLREAYRYYSNIVGKYGMFVQRAFKKLEGLKLTTICPTHGPVWRRDIPKIMDIYQRLSKYECEDGVVIVYGSMYGNTADCAEKIAEKLADRGVRNIIVHNATHSEMSDMISDCFRYKGLIIGAPTYQGDLFPPVKTLMSALEAREVKGKAVGLFGSFTWAAGALPALRKYAESMKLDVLAEVQMKQSLNDDTEAQIEALADAIVEGMKG